MSNRYRVIIIALIIFLSTKISMPIKAIDITGGGLSSGSNSPCGLQNGYIACYIPTFQFRATLVDQDGNRVEGTKSVDFTHFNNKIKETKAFFAKDHMQNISYLDENGKYYYKYETSTDRNGNYYFTGGTTDTSSQLEYVYINMVNDISKYQKNGIDNPDKYSQFVNEFITNVKNQAVNIRYNTDSGSIKLDFLSLFLYKSGFLTKPEFINKNEAKRKEIADNNYYLIIEPTYLIYYNTSPTGKKEYKYGTSNEIIQWMLKEITNNPLKYNNGYLTGLSLNFIYQAACNLYTPNQEGFRKIEYTNCAQNSTVGKVNHTIIARSDRPGIMKTVLNTSNGYGVYVLKLGDVITTPDNEDIDINYNIDLCNLENGIIKSEVKGIDDNTIKNDYLKFKETDHPAYCYDEVNYDFSSFYKNYNFKILSNFEMPRGTVTINRSCYFPNKQSYEENIQDIKKFSNYEDMKINLNIFNKEYFINKISIDKDEEQDNRIKTGLYTGEQQGWVHFVETISYGYSDDKGNEKINISLNSPIGKQRGVLDFSNFSIDTLFGNSKLLKKLVEEKGTLTDNHTTYRLGYSITGIDTPITYKFMEETWVKDELTCKFDYEVTGGGEHESIIGVEFRVISLSNPFPARDGSSRIPGTNWLDKENYVYNYITNNRGVQSYYRNKADCTTGKCNVIDPEMMYVEMQPMYTITLDPSTMMKIRNYNKGKNYSDITLDCDDNNRQCTSEFLRNNKIIPSKNLDGVCSNSTNFRKVTENHNLNEETFRQKIYGSYPYELAYDLNLNNKMDTEDLEIYLNQNQNTYYYTCAYKTYKSGG